MKQLCMVIICFIVSVATLRAQGFISQSQEEVTKKSTGCLSCHRGIESMHKNEAVKLGCVDCHGGNAEGTTLVAGHVSARYPEWWKTSANPERSYTLLNREDPAFIKFVNPGDLRIADETCGPCHKDETRNVRKSLMTTSTLLWGGAAYNNGIVSLSRAIIRFFFWMRLFWMVLRSLVLIKFFALGDIDNRSCRYGKYSPLMSSHVFE